MFVMSFNQTCVMQWHSIRPNVSTYKMTDILFSYLDFVVIECVIKSSRLFSDWICIQLNTPLLRGVIHLPVTMNLYKDMSCNASSPVTHTLPLHLHVTQTLPSSICIFTQSPHVMSIYFATVFSEQSWSSLWWEYIWKEMLGLSWQWCEWRYKLVYLEFIKCWLQWQYHSNIYDLIAALVPLYGMDEQG
jgi:hypothetical protein